MTHSTTNSNDATLQGWFEGRVPADWFTGAPEVTHDRDEIVLIGALADPSPEAKAGDAGSGADADARRVAARQGRIEGFREDTRQLRMRIADEAEARFARKVAWGVRCGDQEEIFTNLSVPVMTRLRQPERRVLDTLVDAGVARSRSDALAWCVRLTGENSDAWLSRLRAALRHVEEVRDQGPGGA
jgi:hypothetical protein